MLRHPDRSTTWAGAGVLRFRSPLGGGVEEVRRTFDARIDRLVEAFPIVGARLGGQVWLPGEPNPLAISYGGEAVPPDLVGGFDLTREAPLRALADADGRWLSIAVHHAAIDGPSVVGILQVLCGQAPRLVHHDRSLARRSAPPVSAARRLLAPADPVAPSREPPRNEVFAHVPLPPLGRGGTVRLPAALVAAARAHNERLGAPLRRIGLSLSIAELDEDAGTSVASYRRIDVLAGTPVAAAVKKALATPEEPWEILHAPRALRLLSPVASRLSDTILLSNFGRLDLAGVESFEVYPVARGRSAVAFGAVRVAGGSSTLTLRAKHLSPSDADRILQGALDHLDSQKAIG
jgi:hypothetical protein